MLFNRSLHSEGLKKHSLLLFILHSLFRIPVQIYTHVHSICFALELFKKYWVSSAVENISNQSSLKTFMAALYNRFKKKTKKNLLNLELKINNYFSNNIREVQDAFWF